MHYSMMKHWGLQVSPVFSFISSEAGVLWDKPSIRWATLDNRPISISIDQCRKAEINVLMVSGNKVENTRDLDSEMAQLRRLDSGSQQGHESGFFTKVILKYQNELNAYKIIKIILTVFRTINPN